ncbi:MAG: tyrosine-protein phosphatase [Elusimicrobiales bacterium]|jgi:pimeloyl-ACP methyl ester carboxylesterase
MVSKKSVAVILALAASALPGRAIYADELSTLSGLANGTTTKTALPVVNPPEAPAPAAYAGYKRAPGKNITGDYYSAITAVAAAGAGDDAKYKKLSGYRILFVPGFMTNPSVDPDLLYKEGGAINLMKGVMPTYFEEQITWLRASGLDAGIVDIESEAGIKHNAELIAAQISRSPKPVIIFSHSKGGLDTLEALIRRPDLRRKVRGLVSIQSPYFGTPVADWVLLGRHSLSPASAAALKLLGGNLESVKDLSVKSRMDYQAENAGQIAAITAAIPTISFGAWKNEEKGAMDSLFEPTRDLMLGWGIKSDGLVPVDSEMLPGANQIAIEGLDHLATVIKVQKPAFERVNFIRTLLTLLMNKGVPALEESKPENVGGLIHTGDPAEPMHFGRVDIAPDSDLRGIAYRGGQPAPATYRFLKDRGVDTIINIRNMTLPDWKQCKKIGIKCVNHPIWALDPDILGGVTIGDKELGGIVLHENKYFLAAYRTAVKELKAGRTIYIHCQGGTDRTGAVAAALMIRSYACGKNFNSPELRDNVMATMQTFGFWNHVFPSWGVEIKDWVNNFQIHKEWICK